MKNYHSKIFLLVGTIIICWSSCSEAFNGVWCDSSEPTVHYSLKKQTAGLERQEQYVTKIFSPLIWLLIEICRIKQRGRDWEWHMDKWTSRRLEAVIDDILQKTERAREIEDVSENRNGPYSLTGSSQTPVSAGIWFSVTKTHTHSLSNLQLRADVQAWYIAYGVWGLLNTTDEPSFTCCPVEQS